jgi:hypothetical protein
MSKSKIFARYRTPTTKTRPDGSKYSTHIYVVDDASQDAFIAECEARGIKVYTSEDGKALIYNPRNLGARVPVVFTKDNRVGLDMTAYNYQLQLMKDAGMFRMPTAASASVETSDEESPTPNAKKSSKAKADDLG